MAVVQIFVGVDLINIYKYPPLDIGDEMNEMNYCMPYLNTDGNLSSSSDGLRVV